ncbi:hypothetical protein [Mycobacterium uberis]|nr:hypothetical protein [Mycobacterium uberis]
MSEPEGTLLRSITVSLGFASVFDSSGVLAAGTAVSYRTFSISPADL